MPTSDSFRLGPLYAVALYDRNTGDIVHLHYQMTIAGAPAPDARSMEKDALELAARHHNAPATLGILHAGETDPSQSYRVDVQKQVLIRNPPRALFPQQVRGPIKP